MLIMVQILTMTTIMMINEENDNDDAYNIHERNRTNNDTQEE